MNQNQVSWLWIACVFPFSSNHQAFEVWFLKQNVQRPAFYLLCGITDYLFPYVSIGFPLGVGIISFQVKSHTLSFFIILLKKKGPCASSRGRQRFIITAFAFQRRCQVSIPCCNFTLCYNPKVYINLLLLNSTTLGCRWSCYLSLGGDSICLWGQLFLTVGL